MGFFVEVVRRDQDSMKELVYAVEKFRGAISLMSAPAAKARSEPVRRMQRVVGVDWAVVRAVLSSVIRGVERALRALGRWSVTGDGFVLLVREFIWRDRRESCGEKYFG